MNPVHAPTPSTSLCRARGLGLAWPDGAPLWQGLDFDLLPGLGFVLGGDGRGKTTLLRVLAGEMHATTGSLQRDAGAVFWATPADARHDAASARAWLAEQRARWPAWDNDAERTTIEAFALADHLDKAMHMLSTGSRRKLGLLAAVASGAALTLLDLPYAALDAPSRRWLTDRLRRAATDTVRAWVVADYAVPPALGDLPLAGVIALGD